MITSYFLLDQQKNLEQLVDEANQINPTIQLTIKHTSIQNEDPEDKYNCEDLKVVPFLDTLVSIEEGKIEVDLYRKVTDRNQYLLPSSCHDKSVTRVIQLSPL